MILDISGTKNKEVSIFGNKDEDEIKKEEDRK